MLGDGTKRRHWRGRDHVRENDSCVRPGTRETETEGVKKLKLAKSMQWSNAKNMWVRSKHENDSVKERRVKLAGQRLCVSSTSNFSKNNSLCL